MKLSRKNNIYNTSTYTIRLPYLDLRMLYLCISHLFLLTMFHCEFFPHFFFKKPTFTLLISSQQYIFEI